MLFKRRQWCTKPICASLIDWYALAFVYCAVSGCSAESPGSLRLQDLSHTFDKTTIYWVTERRLNMTVTQNGTVPGQHYWLQTEDIAAATHGGTHLDAPCHFAPGRWCVSDIPIERLAVPVSVIDISHEVGDDPNVHLTLQHVLDWERQHGPIADGNLLLVRTGWSRFWPDPLTYSGTTKRRAELLRFPSIRAEVARWLVANRAIVGIGIDTMSFDVPGGRPENHITILGNNIYALENVKLAEPLPPTGVKAYVMPMKLKDASGAPCRILVEVPSAKVGMLSVPFSSSRPWSYVPFRW